MDGLLATRTAQRVYEFMQTHNLLVDAKRLLLAVSGGADSMALLHLVHDFVRTGQYPCELICAHLNHRLRGTAADEDEHFVATQAHRLGVRFVSTPLPVRDLAQAEKLSIETAARQLRLAQLLAWAEEYGCQAVATGHHRDDNAETVLFRLWRGTGYRGLAGIHPVRWLGGSVHLVRPLLPLTRDEIRAYLKERDLPWHDDPTNRDVSIRRNFVRHRLLPELQDTGSFSLPSALSDLAQGAYALEQRLERAVTPLWSGSTQQSQDAVTISVAVFRSVSPWLQIAWLQRALEHLGCGLRDVDKRHYHAMQALTQKSTPGPRHDLPQGFSVERQGRDLVLKAPTCDVVPAEHPPTVLAVPGITHWGPYTMTATLLPTREGSFTHSAENRSPFREWLDLDRISGPLTIRHRCPGDRFHPLGSHGSRKVGRFLTDMKISDTDRHTVAVITDQERILWVAPLRLSEAAKMTTETRRILQLEFKTDAGNAGRSRRACECP